MPTRVPPRVAAERARAANATAALGSMTSPVHVAHVLHRVDDVGLGNGNRARRRARRGSRSVRSEQPVRRPSAIVAFRSTGTPPMTRMPAAREARSRHEPAAADRCDDHVEAVDLIEQFQRRSSGAGDDTLVVERMDLDRAGSASTCSRARRRARRALARTT